MSFAKYYQAINAYIFPRCQQNHHEDYQLNEFCVQDDCDYNFLPLCAVCRFNMHKSIQEKHEFKPLKVIFTDIIRQLEEISNTVSDKDINIVDEMFNELAKQIKNTFKLLGQLQDYISGYKVILDQWMKVEQEEAKFIKSIMRKMLSDNQEVTLRKGLKDIAKVTTVQKGTVLVVESKDTDKKQESINKAKQMVEFLQKELQNLNIQTIIEKLQKEFPIAKPVVQEDEQRYQEEQTASTAPNYYSTSQHSHHKSGAGHQMIEELRPLIREELEKALQSYNSVKNFSKIDINEPEHNKLQQINDTNLKKN